MQYRYLGNSGQVIPAMMLGTATFAGSTEMFKKWGDTKLPQAKELIKLCMDNGCYAFDTADCYSLGDSELILGEALKDYRRDEVFISTKTGMAMSENPNDIGTSRVKIIRSVDASLKRLQTDYIDLYYLHCYDAMTPHLESLQALNELVKAGKIHYFGVSNYSAWHLMKMLSVADSYSISRPSAHQAYYSLAAREFENELMPLGVEEGVGTLVWSPLSGSMLSGRIKRGFEDIKDSRLSTGGAWDIDRNHLYNITDCLEIIQKETGYSFAQISLAWVLTRPTVSSLVIGAKNTTQLMSNLKASDILLDSQHIEMLDRASQTKLAYPYWHQRFTFNNRDPYSVKRY
ncbi:aldo/keto reductase [Helicobacter muridarum]|uniref:Aldo-keto reductase n=1 Tax=Helicobacter muridarum TaxID=216 RepID=A0A099TXX7_9HELI|nr:aldo/keto reductase [Helicobacter muridarum]TLD99284.1 aldo/keto reductase [Helicobacter muridarum]STQ86126.1 aldo-keto reductase [Helicobacter muridarum]